MIGLIPFGAVLVALAMVAAFFIGGGAMLFYIMKHFLYGTVLTWVVRVFGGLVGKKFGKAKAA